jgi:hypothetical protein
MKYFFHFERNFFTIDETDSKTDSNFPLSIGIKSTVGSQPMYRTTGVRISPYIRPQRCTSKMLVDFIVYVHLHDKHK